MTKDYERYDKAGFSCIHLFLSPCSTEEDIADKVMTSDDENTKSG